MKVSRGDGPPVYKSGSPLDRPVPPIFVGIVSLTRSGENVLVSPRYPRTPLLRPSRPVPRVEPGRMTPPFTLSPESDGDSHPYHPHRRFLLWTDTSSVSVRTRGLSRRLCVFLLYD